MVGALASLLSDQLVKLYSIDSVAGQAWLSEDNEIETAADMQNRFDAAIYHEVVPAIRSDCRDESVEIIATGPSIGAFNALAAITRHPDVFRAAICMSGTYDLSKFLQGAPNRDYQDCSPLHFLPDLPDDSQQLAALRKRFILLTHGTGRWEEPEQSWRAASALGERSIPNRVDEWSADHDHDWPTWREMLPQYLEELLD